MIDLTICISVHNTAEYLPRCLDSIFSQEELNCEIILVNNGSTDNSEEIMWKYHEKFPNIKVIRQEDRGLAQGRQTGINNASGEYIAFLDADDYVFNNIYPKALKYAKEYSLDIVEFCTMRGEKVLKSPFEGICKCHDILKEYFWGKKTIYPMMWLRIYKRSLFDIPVLPSIYVNNEDIFAYPCLLYNGNTIGFISDIGHNYSLDNSSAVMIQLRKDKAFTEKYYENRRKTLLCIDHIENYIGTGNLQIEFAREFNQYKQRVMVTYLFSDVFGVSVSSLKDDLVAQFGFDSKFQLMKYIRKNTENNSDVNRMIKYFGFPVAYWIHRIRKASR